MRRAVPGVAILGMLVLLLAGCSDAPRLPELHEDPGPDDALAPYVDTESLVVESVCFVGEKDGVKLFLAESTLPAEGECLVVDPNETQWTVACGGLGLGTLAPGIGEFKISEAEVPGFERVSESVWARWS